MCADFDLYFYQTAGINRCTDTCWDRQNADLLPLLAFWSNVALFSKPYTSIIKNVNFTIL